MLCKFLHIPCIIYFIILQSIRYIKLGFAFNYRWVTSLMLGKCSKIPRTSLFLILYFKGLLAKITHTYSTVGPVVRYMLYHIYSVVNIHIKLLLFLYGTNSKSLQTGASYCVGQYGDENDDDVPSRFWVPLISQHIITPCLYFIMILTKLVAQPNLTKRTTKS